MAVLSIPVLVTVRVPIRLDNRVSAPLSPFLGISDEVKEAVAKRFGIEPSGVIYQVLQAFGDQRVVAEVNKIFPLGRFEQDHAVYFVANDVLDVLYPIVSRYFPEGTRIDVYTETFKDDIDMRGHSATSVSQAGAMAPR